MLVHRNFVSSSRTFPLHQLFLLGLFVMVGKVAVQAFPIETVASSSTSPPPALPASAVESNVRRPGKAPALELQGAAESEILLGYTSVATGTGEQFKKEAKGKSKPVENQKPIWERVSEDWSWIPEHYLIRPRPLPPKSLKPVKKGVLSNLKSKFKSGSKGSNQLPYDVRKNQWACKVIFKYPREDLNEIEQSFVTIEEFKEDLNLSMDRHLALARGKPKWSNLIAISHTDRDFIMWFAHDNLEMVRMCDCEPEADWIKRIDDWEISKWEDLFPSLVKAFPQAKMNVLYSWLLDAPKDESSQDPGVGSSRSQG